MSESPIPRVKFSPTPHNNDRYTALPRNRRYSQSSAPEPRPTLRTRRRSSSVTTTRPYIAPTSSSITSQFVPSPKEENRNPFKGSEISLGSRRKRHYFKPDPNIIFSELNQQLGYFGNTPLREGPIRDFLDIDEIVALHDRDIMDSREKEDMRNGRIPMVNRDLLPVFGTSLRQVSMYAATYAPVNSGSSTCAFEVPLIVLTCITELQRRRLSSPLPFVQSNAISRRRLLHLSQAFDSPPYTAQTLISESTVDLCALLKTYVLALPETAFSSAVSEGLWRWCIRPSLEEKDIAMLEAMDASVLSDAEITRVHVAALLFRLLPSANLGLLIHIFNFLSCLRGKPPDDENPHEVLASYTEIGRILGEALFGRITNQKSILRKNQIVHGNARAVSMMVWVLRRWSEIERGISGSPPPSVQTPQETWYSEGLKHIQVSDGSSSTLVNGVRDGKGKEMEETPTSSWLKGTEMVLEASIFRRDENKSASSTQALDERLADTSENLLAPVDVPSEVEVQLPNPYGGVEVEDEYLQEKPYSRSQVPSQGFGPSATQPDRKPDHSGSELIGALKRIGDLEVELEAKRLAEASAKEREEVIEVRAAKAQEELQAMREKAEALTEEKKRLEKENRDAQNKVLCLQESVAGYEYALSNMRRDKEATAAERDGAQKLLEDIKKLLSLTTESSLGNAEAHPVNSECLM